MPSLSAEGRAPRAGHADMANAIRALAMDAVEQARSGHPGMPMGLADVATVLFGRFLKFDPSRPDWPDRDRFVLSNGHGSMLLYALLYLTGYPDIDIDEIRNFRQLGSRTAGHPEYGVAAGIETTTGPLGQGLANAVGMALAERNMAARFGSELVDHHTYVVCGDGCLMEGISQEAISLAGHLRLDRLIVLYDSNDISIDGPTSLAFSDDARARFESAGWHTQRVDGHDPEAVAAAIAAAKAEPRPSMIECRTVIGFGAPTKAGTAASHGAPLGADEIAGTREGLGWPHAPFTVPDAILEAWRTVGERGRDARAAWEARRAALGEGRRAAFDAAVAGDLPAGLSEALAGLKRSFADEGPTIATRVANQRVIGAIADALPCLIGGSADLTGSNGTKTDALVPIAPGDYGGRYLYFGVREHAMGAVMNGMALHGGVIPFGGTFLTFTDYCRPAIRLSALMELRVIYVMTHDSIGLGEDGPTHQPIEHLASLRAMPNLLLFRPADAVETAECWELALANAERPSVLALTRQGVPCLRAGAGGNGTGNACAHGGYVLREASGETPRVVLLATGSECAIADEARQTLEAAGVPTRLVSLPCWALFDEQEPSYREGVLGGADTVRIAVEAASPFGWERYVGPAGAIVGMRGFGASAPAKDLYAHFGITADAVVAAAKARL
jgi:transketolase